MTVTDETEPAEVITDHDEAVHDLSVYDPPADVDEEGDPEAEDRPEGAPVYAVDHYRNNGELIAAAARLGYIKGRVLDPTYGKGTWWKVWRPMELVYCDLDATKSPILGSVDFTTPPERWLGYFDTIAYDPPYKLNGTPDPVVDAAYGVDEATRWQARMDLIFRGLVALDTCLGDSGRFLVKCQDQVCSGQVRWQTHEVTNVMEALGYRLQDRLDMLGSRPQPATNPDGSKRRQVHARRNTSTLLVFRKAGPTQLQLPPEVVGDALPAQAPPEP